MISYYELLGMIKEGKAQKKIRVHLTSEPRIYKRDDDVGEYCYYVLDNKNEENNEYKYYLTESYLESMMFDENIEILDKEKIEKLNLHPDDWTTPTQCDLVLSNKIDEIIDILNRKGE